MRPPNGSHAKKVLHSRNTLPVPAKLLVEIGAPAATAPATEAGGRVLYRRAPSANLGILGGSRSAAEQLIQTLVRQVELDTGAHCLLNLLQNRPGTKCCTIPKLKTTKPVKPRPKKKARRDATPLVTKDPKPMAAPDDGGWTPVLSRASRQPGWTVRPKDWNSAVVRYDDLCKTIQDEGGQLKGGALRPNGEKSIVLRNMLAVMARCTPCSIPGRLDPDSQAERVLRGNKVAMPNTDLPVFKAAEKNPQRSFATWGTGRARSVLDMEETRRSTGLPDGQANQALTTSGSLTLSLPPSAPRGKPMGAR